MIAAAFEIMRHSVTSAASPTTCHVVLKAQHGPSSLVNLRNWAYSRRVDVLVAGKRLRDGRRDNYCECKSVVTAASKLIPRRRAVLKIKNAGRPVEGPAPHHTAGLEYFQSTPVGRNKKLRHRRTARRVFYRRTRFFFHGPPSDLPAHL